MTNEKIAIYRKKIYQKIKNIVFLCLLGGCAPSVDQSLEGTFNQRRATMRQEFIKPVLEPLSANIPITPSDKILEKPISLVVIDPIPLKDIFAQIFKQTPLSFEMSPEISGSGIIKVHHKPLRKVLQRLCQMHQLRYDQEEDHIRLTIDVPYIKEYDIHALSLKRISKHQVMVATNLSNTMTTNNGSDSQLNGESQTDFWQELTENLQTILGKNIEGVHFSFNRQAGLMIVKAKQQQHEFIKTYLDSLNKRLNAQVLIEAKIIEISLNKQHKSGINWRFFHHHLGIAAPLGDLVEGVLSKNQVASKDRFTVAVEGKDMNIILNLLETFGKTRTLSNPRLTVTNNQSALLKVAQNFVYFVTKYDRQYMPLTSKLDAAFALESPLVNVSSEVHTVPIGLVIVVQPSIDEKTQEITLALRPTISSIKKMVDDPAVMIASDQKVSSQVPIVEVREIDSVLKLRSGEIAIVGGLMQDSHLDDVAGFPGAHDIPGASFLFSSQDDHQHLTELVILLRATIVNSSSFPERDRQLYQTFYPASSRSSV